VQPAKKVAAHTSLASKQAAASTQDNLLISFATQLLKQEPKILFV
jgi:hypothetical protein